MQKRLRPKRKLKIAIFHLAFIYSGGGERLVLEEAIGLSKLGCEVTCFSPVVDRKNCFPELLSKVEIKRLFPKLPKWFPDRELISILISCILTPLFFLRFKEYDLYFGANQPGPWIAYALAKLNKKPYAIYLAQPTRIIHPRLIDQKIGFRLNDGFTLLNLIPKLFKPIFGFFDTKSIKEAPLVFSNGSYAKGLLEEVYGIKTVNCPAGTHLGGKPTQEIIASRFKGFVKLNAVKIKKPYVLLTNRHFPHKKFEYAIDAVLLIKKKIPLVITGQETAYTRFLKKKYKKEKNIYFVGILAERELAKAYKNASVYVYSAPEEDFGMGIIEAMGFGVPTVAFGNAGPTGIIENGKDSFLARPFSIKDFSEKIELVLKNRKLYTKIAYAAFEKVANHFSYERHNRLLLKHFLKFLG